MKYFGVGQVSGQLVLVGGEVASTEKVTGDMHVFTNESQQWEKLIPAMPTARRAPSVVSHSTVLIACGGSHDSKRVVTVELYSSETSQWYQCPPLPSPDDSMCTVGDTVFFVGGYGASFATSSVFSASLSSLIDRATHHTDSSDRLWTTLKDTRRLDNSALASIGGCLLALGGKTKCWWLDSEVTSSIDIYLPTNSTALVPLETGRLPLRLMQLTAVLLPTNELLIIGGCNHEEKECKQVHKASIEV